jgi:hypothetical protein
MEAKHSSKMSVIFYRITRRHNPENITLHGHHCENLKFRTIYKSALRKVHSSKGRGRRRRGRRKRRRRRTEHSVNLQHTSCTKMHFNQIGLQKLFPYHAV